MSDRYIPVKDISSPFWKILDCKKDEFVEEWAKSRYGGNEMRQLRYNYPESAQYKADELNKENNENG